MAYYEAERCPFKTRMIKIAIVIIRAELVRCNGDKQRAATSLGMPRYTLYKYLDLANQLEDDHIKDRELELISIGLKQLIGG